MNTLKDIIKDALFDLGIEDEELSTLDEKAEDIHTAIINYLNK